MIAFYKKTKRFIDQFVSKTDFRRAHSPSVSLKNSKFSPQKSISNNPKLKQISRQYDGKLLLRSEISFADEQFVRLTKQNYFSRIKGIKKSLFSVQCARCNNNQRSLFGYLPCALCDEKHLYCRNCIMMGRVSVCEALYKWTGPRYPWPSYKRTCTWKGELTFAQKRASTAVKQAVLHNNRLLVWAVTGAGKTEILFEGIELALSQGKRICIATPRADVVRELLPRLRQAFATIPIQALYGKSRDREGTAQLLIMTTHQLLRFKNAFDVMIIDEIDAFPYHKDRTLQFATKRAMKTTSSAIYLTATPRRDLKHQIRMRQLAHCFVPIRYHENPLPVPLTISDYTLLNQLNQNNLPKSFLHWLDHRIRNDRQLLMFVPTIQLADTLNEELALILKEKGLTKTKKATASVHAEDPDRERKIKQFRKKEIYALITTTILERGVTFPSIDVVVLQANHEVFDEAALVQIAGRAGRNKKDPTGEVLFIHDGKTEAIDRAILSIKKMNDRGLKLLNKNRKNVQ